MKEVSTENLANKETKVIDLGAFKKKKEIDSELAQGRDPLYVSHLDGKMKGSPHMKRPEAADFGDRLQRIRTSLEKINSLITELKKMSNTTTQGQMSESARK